MPSPPCVGAHVPRRDQGCARPGTSRSPARRRAPARRRTTRTGIVSTPVRSRSRPRSARSTGTCRLMWSMPSSVRRCRTRRDAGHHSVCQSSYITRARSGRRGAAGPATPAAPMRGDRRRAAASGSSTSRTSIASSSTATPEDHAHLLRRQRPREREREEDGDHHGRGREDHAPGVGETADRRVLRVVRAVPVLLRRREQEHRVVHRDREDHREEEDRAPTRRGSPGARSRAAPRRGRSGRSAGRSPNAAPVASRFVSTPSAAIRGAWSATSRSRKPSTSTTPITSGVFAASARSRSWFSATAPPTSASCGSARRSRSIVAPTLRLDGSAAGVAWISARPPLPVCGGPTRAMPGSRRASRRRPRSLRARDDDLQRAGRADAECLLHLRVADAGSRRSRARP